MTSAADAKGLIETTAAALRKASPRAEYKIVVDCQSRRGFVLIATCIAMTVLLGFAALGIDIGRMYVIKSELQAFTDAAALSAATELDGSDAGIARAREAATRLASGEHAMKCDLGTRAITEIEPSFASGQTSPDPRSWQPAPQAAAEFRFARVTARAPAPLIFMRLFQARDASEVASSSVAVKTQAEARLVE